MLTANLAAEVSPTMGSCFPKSSRHTESGALATGCTPRGAKRETHRWIKPERAKCQMAGGPAGKREEGQLKPRDQLCRRRRRALGREMGKSSGDEMGDKGEALGGIV